MFKDLALVLAPRRQKKPEWGCWYQKNEASNTSLWQKLGNDSQQHPDHPLEQGSEFLLCAPKTIPVNNLAERDIFRVCEFLRCILAKRAFRVFKITIYKGNQIVGYSSSLLESVIPLKARQPCLYSERDEQMSTARTTVFEIQNTTHLSPWALHKERLWPFRQVIMHLTSPTLSKESQWGLWTCWM